MIRRPILLYPWGYRKGYSTPTTLITLIKQGECMDLTKAFDCVNPELFLAKLDICGFGEQALLKICNGTNR